MPLPDLLPIVPFTRPVRGEVSLPGSKSLTNRALLLAALCDKPVTLTGALFSEDTHLMVEALRQLGFVITDDKQQQTIYIEGRGGKIPAERANLFVGLAGTAARFLTALCAAAPGGVYRIDGIPQMRKRPMKGLIDALRALGADIRCLGEEGFFPLEIHARGLRGGAVSIDAAESSQMLSALLMVAPLTGREVAISLAGPVRLPFVHMTMMLQAEFGLKAINQQHSSTFVVTPGRYTSPGRYPVEPDATAASYFLALPLVAAGQLHIRDLRGPGRGLQGDAQVISVFEHVGLKLQVRPDGLDVSYAAGGVRQNITQDFAPFSDTFLTFAALSPLLVGKTRISGIAHTRKQETDRVAGMYNELKKLGQTVEQGDDWLEIQPQPLRVGQTIETYGDHRFAMSFGILGCHDLHGSGRPWLTIKDPACCAKTFPHFFELLETLRKKSLAP